ncbi:ATPase family AAA domain-containing protein 5-like [Haliotis asinina]|uniref:ATPase family AAA domain-containing protein 5-like n=1 Tax=Haliotis asinina TaxID=109174 RepID=UPI00353201E1
MLEDKIECDKANKAGIGSPQSSILDFFVSPNNSTASKKQKEKCQPTNLQESSEKVEAVEKQENAVKGQGHDSNDNLTAVSNESCESVILLSDESNSQCNGHTTQADLLNLSGVSNRKRSKRDGKSGKKSKTMASDCAEGENGEKDNKKKSSKKLTLQKQKSVETKPEDVTSQVPVVNETENKIYNSVSKIKDEGQTSKKRKRNDIDETERKRNRTSESTDAPADQCPAMEMSYEAFIQSLTPRGCADKTAPKKEDVSSRDEKEDLSKMVKEGDALQEEGVQILTAKQEDPPKEVVNSNKLKDSKKKKSAKASLFKEGSETDIPPVKDDSSGDDGEKKTPSILNFFAKVNTDKNSEHQIVTVMADVHHEPTKEKSTSKKSHENQSVASPIVLSPKSPGVVKLDEDIEMLSSETVVEVMTSRNKKDKSSVKAKSGDKTVLRIDEKVEELKEEVTIEKVEAAPRSAEVDAFLKSSDTPTVHAKSAQATLSFTKTGLKATSAAIPSSKTRVRTQSESRSAKIGSEDSDKSEVKKVKKRRGKKKKDDGKEKSKLDDSVLSSDGPESPKEVRARRMKYQVSSLQFDDSRRTLIKMKIRLKKTTSSGEETEFTPRSSKTKGQKQAKAQQLLEKAKKVKKTKKSKVKHKATRKRESVTSGNESFVDLDSSTDGGGRRRSARLAVHVIPEPITVEDEDDESEDKPVKVKKSTKTPLKSKPQDVSKTLKAKDSPRKLKAKETPQKLKVKDSPRKLAKDSPSKPKSKGKLASIFMGKLKPEVKLKEPEDPEKVRLRQAFLMSDVPDALKRQVVAVAAVQSSMETTGLPTISHVQQIPESREENSVWNLAPVKLPLRVLEPFHQGLLINWADLGSHKVVSPAKSELFKDFRFHLELAEGVVDELLAEVEVGVRGLPVRQIYADMKRKLEEDLRSQEPSIDAAKVSQPSTESTKQEAVEKKKKGRGRTKGAKLSLSKEAAESVPTPEVIRVGEMMWTERYQPTHSMEVLGHTAHLQKLKSWLLEWKHRTHKEARKMRLQMLKQAQPKAVVKAAEEDNAWWGEEDSDFDMDTDDSDDEDDRLCNTMVITGPHGIGKTASVYALAQELGYKVIEVNAASSRNGKKILSKLQEATQSHQVATSKDGGSNSMMAALSGSTSSSAAKPAKKEAKLPTAFTNLFRKAGSKSDPVEVVDLEADTAEKSKKEPKQKRKREKDVDKVEKSPKKARKELKAKPNPVRDEGSQSGGLELSTTTLILFDEAEISFEDDKGYLPAIQHFMMRTKIPIILTTTDSSFSSQLQARYESLTFKQPSQLTIAGHLQTICLVEQVRTSLDDMLTLVRLHGGDIRKCLLWLQYWLSSGGGASKIHQPVNTTPRTVQLSVDDNICSQDSDSQGASVGTSAAPENDDYDDFVVSKPSLGRKKRVLDDDDSSGSNVFPSQLSTQPDSGSSSNFPQVHCLRLENLAGISQPLPDVIEKVLQSYLQGRCDDQQMRKLQEMCENLNSIGMSSLSGNLFHLLPLPKVWPQASSLLLGSTKTVSNKNKLSRIRTDVFDDEASSDAHEEEKETEKLVTDKNSETKEQKVLNSKCLNAFSQYYDSMCDLDIMGTCTEIMTRQQCYAESWSDSRTMSDCPTMALLTHEHNTEMDLRSARHLYGNIMTAVDSYRECQAGDKLPEEVYLPVPGGQTAFSLLASEPRLSGSVRRTHENISDCLPMNIHCSHCSVHMDYLPSLRAISRAEQHRQIAKTKRRFHHYFDNIGMSVKETSLNVLCQTFS